MTRHRSLFVAVAATAWLALPGCDDGGGSPTGADSDSDTDSDTDADYPVGPYGFDPSMELDTDMSSPGTWTGDGDVIPDVCLNNALGDEVCLGELYRSPEVDLLFVDFTTMW